MSFLLFFIDGLGIPENKEAWTNYPAIYRILNDGKPLDAQCGVEGVPQSATGQTTLYTGKNSAEILGFHLEGFPNEKLREVICEKNILSHLSEKGKKVCFANGYRSENKKELLESKFHSVTTVMCLSALGDVRHKTTLREKKAVFHDISNLTFPEKDELPQISSEEAFEILSELIQENDFILFEYFLTDWIGHGRLKESREKHLNSLNKILELLIKSAEKGNLNLLVVSDHGNIENCNQKGHTLNPVPLFYLGMKEELLFQKTHCLKDVFHGIMEYFEL